MLIGLAGNHLLLRFSLLCSVTARKLSEKVHHIYAELVKLRNKQCNHHLKIWWIRKKIKTKKDSRSKTLFGKPFGRRKISNRSEFRLKDFVRGQKRRTQIYSPRIYVFRVVLPLSIWSLFLCLCRLHDRIQCMSNRQHTHAWRSRWDGRRRFYFLSLWLLFGVYSDHIFEFCVVRVACLLCTRKKMWMKNILHCFYCEARVYIMCWKSNEETHKKNEEINK